MRVVHSLSQVGDTEDRRRCAKATDRRGIVSQNSSRTRSLAKVSCARLPLSGACPLHKQESGRGEPIREINENVQSTRRSSSEKGFKKGLGSQTAMTPEAELIALAESKGQMLTEHRLGALPKMLDAAIEAGMGAEGERAEAPRQRGWSIGERVNSMRSRSAWCLVQHKGTFCRCNKKRAQRLRSKAG
jgi:hypothetical protein